MPRFKVMVEVEGHQYIEVEAEDEDEAIEIATEEHMDWVEDPFYPEVRRNPKKI